MTDTYIYPTNSNRLNKIERASGNRNFTYDSAGNPINRTAADNSTQTFNFNNANRLANVSVNSSLAASYSYNPLGQRTVKTLANGTKEIYHYDEAGHLISVTDGTGATLREYIYWGDQQIALVNNGIVYYIHSDHLNTPQVITDANQQVVWMGDYEPFGKLAANQTNSIELFSRFPGQYLDTETGLYYNYFRDYDPSIGRYIESDPIGLEGGINTYAYVGGNPIKYSDPLGLLDTPDGGKCTIVGKKIICHPAPGEGKTCEQKAQSFITRCKNNANGEYSSIQNMCKFSMATGIGALATKMGSGISLSTGAKTGLAGAAVVAGVTGVGADAANAVDDAANDVCKPIVDNFLAHCERKGQEMLDECNDDCEQPK